MKTKGKVVALGALVGAMAVAGWMSEVSSQSMAWNWGLNNKRIVQTQTTGGTQADTGQVTIDFYGHSAFKITTPRGTSMMFDPWRNDPSGYWGVWFPSEFPQTKVDIILSTHAHFDHDAIFRPRSPMILDRMVGAFSLGDVKITGLADKHTCEAPGWYAWTDVLAEFKIEACPPDNPGHLDNTIFIVETGGMNIVVWGDNRDQPTDFVWKALETAGVDVLILPIDGSQHILSYAQADAIIDRLNPHIVIPEHYLTIGTSITLTTLGTADEWVATQANATTLTSATLTLKADAVKKMTKHVMYFGGNAQKE